MPQSRRLVAAHNTALFLLALLVLAGVGLLWVGSSLYSGGGAPTVTKRLCGELLFVDVEPGTYTLDIVITDLISGQTASEDRVIVLYE